MMPDALTALIPIDLQQAFDEPRWGVRNNPGMEANGRRLLAAWRQQGWPLLHVRHDSVSPGSSLRPGQPGHDFRPGFEPLDGEPVVGKSVNAAFIGTDLDLRLRRLGVGSIVLFGLTTDMCVSTTARVGANLGYRTVVVGDACACFALPDPAGGTIAADDLHRAHLATLHAEFARVLATDALLEAAGVR
jgi:nicotinamidase-related amidase